MSGDLYELAVPLIATMIFLTAPLLWFIQKVYGLSQISTFTIGLIMISIGILVICILNGKLKIHLK
ncbi:MAG: hypothetical protein NDF53_03260 [archaeon GB-1867-097]|nr:hypothetical protein [Candidatus Culexmicrobium thermophilum]